jgi:DNA polymerase III delta prime subunit
MDSVESIEIYQRGNNNESFRSIIGDKERNQGYVEFYDLQVKNNHSYIANGNIVHNCHQILGAAQEALLKALEEPPSHVHFILCTTNPEALKDTFKRRCHVYEVKSLNSNQMMQHLKRILKKEKVKNFKESILEKIIELSNGSPGIALKYLDMVIDMTDEDEAINLLKSSGTSEKDVLELCRVLVDFKVNAKTRWGRAKRILQNLSADAESARRPMLGYFNKCLLNNNEGDNFALIIDEFKDSFMYSGKAGLSLACYKAVFMIED